MSNGFAIAAVTAVLKGRLENRLVAADAQSAVGTVSVTALPPDRIQTGGTEPNQLNVFLHHVTHNSGWRNQGNPVRDSNGSRVASPPLALDLHYLVTAFGEDPYVAEILLGLAMQELFEHPVFERDAIRVGLDPPVPDPTLPEELAASALADQIEHIRVIPSTLNSEEMSRLWTALQAQYRATAAYDVGVVLIDGSDPARPSLPVGERGVVVDPLARPRVHHVVAAPAPGESVDPSKPITAAGTVWIRGQGLKGAATRVVIGRTEAQPLGDAVADTRIELDLATIAGLRAGVQTALVVHERDLGIPPVGHEVLTSNSVPVVLRPEATVTAGVDDTDAIDGVTFAEGTFTCTVDPPVGPDQRVVLLLNERDAPPGRPPRGYSLMASPGNGIAAGDETATDVPVPFAGVAEGTYLARIEVDGAAGLLTAGADGRFESPAVTV